jgi:hypothetical protein
MKGASDEAARQRNLREPSRKLKKEQKKTLSPLSEDRALKTQTNKHKSVDANIRLFFGFANFCLFLLKKSGGNEKKEPFSPLNSKINVFRLVKLFKINGSSHFFGKIALPRSP